MKTKGLKFLGPTLDTMYNGVRTSYLPAIGRWMKHPGNTRPDDMDCGPGGYHIVLCCSAIYAPVNWWPWHAEIKGVLGKSPEKARGRCIRLRPVTPALWWRYLRRFGRGAYLRGADLNRADLRNAELNRAGLSNAKLHDAILCDAKLIGADLNRADLNRANLRGADLRDADLSHADLRRANLRDAKLIGAKLIGADLRDADLARADLRNAKLHDAILRDARANYLTIWPSEFNPGSAGVLIINRSYEK